MYLVEINTESGFNRLKPNTVHLIIELYDLPPLRKKFKMHFQNRDEFFSPQVAAVTAVMQSLGPIL